MPLTSIQETIEFASPVIPAADCTECTHCGLPVPRGLLRPESRTQFCCNGCETVYTLLSGAGLTEYYAFRERLGEVGRKVEETSTRGAEFDSPAYRKLYCEVGADGRMQTEMYLEGVHCAACVWLVERLPRVCPSVFESRVNLSRSTVTVTWDPAQSRLSEIAGTLTDLGYRPRPSRGRDAARRRRDELRGLLVRIGVAGASAGNVMLMAFALYSGDVGVDEAGTMNPETIRFFELLSVLVSLPALWAGGIFIRGAWSALRTRTAHMDLPIALGILAGFVWGTVGAFTAKGELYFDSITTLIFLLLVGRYLQRRHQLTASDAAELLHAVVPSEAVVLRGGVRQVLFAEDVQLGDEVVVGSGRVVPVDGIVVRGQSSLDKSLLSGESRPVSVRPGEEAEAGALNLGAEIVVRARHAGVDTRVARLMREVEKALSTRTRLMTQIDRIAGVFTLSVVFLALSVASYWSFRSGTAAVDHALALLIVACPCALGMATPLALSAAVSRAAKTHKLVFSAEALEHLARPLDVVLDKTGTITEGKLSVERFWGDESVLPLVLGAERHSGHPVSAALIRFIEAQDDALRDATLEAGVVDETIGGGLTVRTPEGPLFVGSPRFVAGRLGVDSLRDELPKDGEGKSPVLVARQGGVVAGFWLGDALRADAAESLIILKSWGYRLHLLSGDDPDTVERAADELRSRTLDPEIFTSVRGGATPEEKLASIRDYAGVGRGVCMVGDGVNDAGALAAADVGVAVTGAAEASRLSSDVFLAEPGVAELVRLFRGARATFRAIRRGIVFSLCYNAVGITAAAMGFIGPLMAAVLMPLSSLTVVTNAYRSRTFEDES